MIRVNDFKKNGVVFIHGDVLKDPEDKVHVLTKKDAAVLNEGTFFDNWKVIQFKIRKGNNFRSKVDKDFVFILILSKVDEEKVKPGHGTRYSRPMAKTNMEKTPGDEFISGWLPYLPEDVGATVIQYTGDFSWLSNMYPLETPYETEHGMLPTVEHIYQYNKSKSEGWKRYVASNPNPYDIRSVSRDPKYCSLRPDWEDIKDEVMEEAICYKFSGYNPEVLKKLLALKDWDIIEGNYHNDTYWGYCLKTKVGKNKQGKLIMQRRDELLDKN